MEASRETHKRIIAQRIAAVVADAARLGLVVTVPPVMIGQTPVIDVRAVEPPAAVCPST